MRELVYGVIALCVGIYFVGSWLFGNDKPQKRHVEQPYDQIQNTEEPSKLIYTQGIINFVHIDEKHWRDQDQ